MRRKASNILTMMLSVTIRERVDIEEVGKVAVKVC
jgi:hypothetical protein